MAAFTCAANIGNIEKEFKEERVGSTARVITDEECLGNWLSRLTASL